MIELIGLNNNMELCLVIFLDKQDYVDFLVPELLSLAELNDIPLPFLLSFYAKEITS